MTQGSPGQEELDTLDPKKGALNLLKKRLYLLQLHSSCPWGEMELCPSHLAVKSLCPSGRVPAWSSVCSDLATQGWDLCPPKRSRGTKTFLGLLSPPSAAELAGTG